MNQAERAIRKHLFFHWIAMFIPAIASVIGLQMFTDLNAWGFVSELNIPFRVVVCLSWIPHPEQKYHTHHNILYSSHHRTA